jgi:hypothetical protein
MSDSMQILAALGLGMFLAGLLLSVGLYIGYRAGRAGSPTPTGSASRKQRQRLHRELNQCAALAQQVARHAEQLTAQLSAPTAGASRRMLGTASDLLEQSTGLSLRLEHLLHGTTRRIAVPSRQPAASSAAASEGKLQRQPGAPNAHRNLCPGEEERFSLSAQELGQITELEHSQVASANGAEHKHYPYDCVQTILPWCPGDLHLPSLAEGMAVRCASISGLGIAFYWPALPQFEHLIISLGSDVDLLFMAAQVTSTKPAELDGAAMHLVECRFIRRMRELTQQWTKRPVSKDDRAPQSAELIAG